MSICWDPLTQDQTNLTSCPAIETLGRASAVKMMVYFVVLSCSGKVIERARLFYFYSCPQPHQPYDLLRMEDWRMFKLRLAKRHLYWL